ncbi:single-pass membrane and coiled-coil domain-containing protein 3 [Amia ocellicauda]|uniref:single-pass membrane and coiled-coil domain-containing protein 3 n=1 Tax=Amia ocellicauda TaxID=2972642 RepID=UPI003464AFED|nr:SMCO3 protein [Amia calva]
MALSECVFNNNERRDRLCRLNQTIVEKIKNNFRATNKLSEVLNEHFSCRFQPIAVDEGKTVKENCDFFLKALMKIQAKIEEIDSRLKEKLEPHCYQEILAMKTPSTEQWRKVHNALNGVVSVVSVIACGVLIYLIKNGIIFRSIVTTVGRIAAGFLGCVVISLLGMGIDLICGAIEKSKLDDAIREHEKVLEEFGPASDAYYDGIMQVMARIQVMSELQG